MVRPVARQCSTRRKNVCRCFLCMSCLVPPTTVDIPLWLHSVSLLAPHPGQPGAHMLWRTLPCPCFVRLTFNNRSDNTRPPFTETVPTTRPCLCNLESKGLWNSHTLQHPCWSLLFPSTKRYLLPASNHWTLAEHGAARLQPPSLCSTKVLRNNHKEETSTAPPKNTCRHHVGSSKLTLQSHQKASWTRRPSPVVRWKQARHI